jgi:heme-degrading monooxygenase HmoA
VGWRNTGIRRRYLRQVLDETGIKEIKATKGNHGVWLLRRLHEGRAEFIVISIWDSLASIKAFAGL